MDVTIEVQLTELKMDFSYNPWDMAPDYELEKSSVGDTYQVFVNTENTAKQNDEFIWEQIVDELATMWCVEDMSWKVLGPITSQTQETRPLKKVVEDYNALLRQKGFF